jgi:tRNA(fMet)-specific endonuclease VapC
MILDTNAVSALAGRDLKLLALLGDVARPLLSFVSVGEFRFGLLGSKKAEAGLVFLEALVLAMPVIYPDDGTCVCYSRIADQLKRHGRPIPQNDMWTAALAMQHEVPVLSQDRHFDFVEGVERVEW